MNIYKCLIYGVFKYVWLIFFVCLFVVVGFGVLYFNLDNELLLIEDCGKICIFVCGLDGVGFNFMDR